MVGDVLAERYELEELVGSGGMSSVYRARDRVLDRKVALKVLHQQFISEDEYVERFRREARMVAGLLHQNIVTVIDRGEDSGCPFIVFEFVDGENLKQLVNREGPLPVDRAVELAVLDVIEDEGLAERSAQLGETIRARMLGWQERWDAIGNVRGLGSMLAIELVADAAARAPAPELTHSIVDAALQRGLLLITCGVYGNCIRVLVPLVVTDAELDEALGAWEEALAASLG